MLLVTFTVMPHSFLVKRLFLALCLGPYLAQAEVKPNFVFIFLDDWGRHASAYAKLDGAGSVNDVISTPNFDKIAAEGVLFRNAFVSSPSCTPCRSSLFTGKHFWQTGSASILYGNWDSSLSPFPLELKKAGYHIGKSYKAWGPGEPVDAVFGGAEANFHQAGQRFSKFSAFAMEGSSKASSKGEAKVDASKQKLFNEIKGNLKAFLEARPEGTPFFYYTGPTNTHRSWVKGSGKKLWGIEPDSLKGKLPPFLPDVPEIREDMADYLGEVLAVDGGLGAIYNHLQEIGELENTVIIISGDHGAPGFLLAKCNLYDFGTRVPLAIRVGKNLNFAVKSGRVIDRLTSLIDIAPTFYEFAGIDKHPEVTGQSLLPALTENTSVAKGVDVVFFGRERHVQTAREDHLPYPQRGIRTQNHLFIMNFEPDRWPLGDPKNLTGDQVPDISLVAKETRYTLADDDAGPTKTWVVQNRNLPEVKDYFQRAYGKRPMHELYDLAKDPHQMNNLAGDPNYSEIQATLEKRLMDELIRTQDPRVTGDKLFFEKPPMAGGRK